MNEIRFTPLEVARSARDLRVNHFDELERIQRLNADIVVYPIPSRPIHILTDPKLVKMVFRHDTKEIDKDSIDARVLDKVVDGPNVFTSVGEGARLHREGLKPTLASHDKLRELPKIVDSVVRKITSTWDGQTIKLDDELQIITAQVLATVLFGEDNTDFVSTQVVDDVNTVIDFYSKTMKNLTLPWHARYFTREGRQFRVSRNRLRSNFDSMVNTAELGSHLDSSDPKAVEAEIFTLFFAGHATTATTLTWLLVALDDNPDVLKKIRDGDLSSRDVFRESLRLHPPFWLIVRKVNTPFTISNEDETYSFPKKSYIAYSSFAIHRDERYWDNPNSFDPDRWTSQNSSAYFPFGVGPRSCLGAGFAMTEGPQIINRIVNDFDFRITDRSSIKPDLANAIYTPTSVIARVSKRN